MVVLGHQHHGAHLRHGEAQVRAPRDGVPPGQVAHFAVGALPDPASVVVHVPAGARIGEANPIESQGKGAFVDAVAEFSRRRHA